MGIVWVLCFLAWMILMSRVIKRYDRQGKSLTGSFLLVFIIMMYALTGSLVVVIHNHTVEGKQSWCDKVCPLNHDFKLTLNTL